jgi:hypothetical protein
MDERVSWTHGVWLGVPPASHFVRRTALHAHATGAHHHDPSMLLTTERHRVDRDATTIAEAASAPSTDAPSLVVSSTHVVALRHRPVVALGALLDRSTVESERLVAAHDVSGRACWIPAEAVWSDAEDAEHPQHPRPVGLATARAPERAFAAGLSDRLGWEAVLVFERGGELPLIDAAPADSAMDGDRLVVLDGRLRHEVPTVVVLGDELIRWGAAATWSTAVHRALYGDDGSLAVEDELADVIGLLGDAGLDVVGVDLGTDLLRRANVARRSVQLIPQL